MRQQLELYFQHGNAEIIESQQLAIRLCSELGCSALVSGNDVNPYASIKINAEGETRSVLLDSTALDNSDEYVLMPDS